jgi:hypothetical protein
MVQILFNSVLLLISYDQAEFCINYINQKPIINTGGSTDLVMKNWFNSNKLSLRHNEVELYVQIV